MPGKCPKGVTMRLRYVNVYLVEQAYGGPEEGGWWYEVGEPVKTMPTRAHYLAKLRTRVGDWCDRMNSTRPPMYSVASTGVYVSVVEDNPARGYPSERPYYE